MSNATERFSSRVSNYVKYRPGYPRQIIEILKAECGLTSESVIADLGSGTGKLAELFLENGNRVLGVEPNEAMRKAGETILQGQENFVSVAGSAEHSTLPDASVDLITAGQAFHWFDVPHARVEAIRILKSDGWAVLIWNDRKLVSTPFLTDYEKLLIDFGTDYQEVRHDRALQAIQSFFGSGVQERTLANEQIFDLDGLKGRVFSSSYTPERDQPTFVPMVRRLEEIFRRHQAGGLVTFEYDTKVYFGHLS